MWQRFVRVVRQRKWCALAVGLCALLAPVAVNADNPAAALAGGTHVPAHSAPLIALDKRLSTPMTNPPAVVLTIDDAIDADEMAVPGQSITYTLVFTNIGDTAVTNVRLVAAVPANTHLANASEPGWSCVTHSNQRSQSPCAMGLAALAAQAAGTAELVVVVNNPLSATVRAVVIEASVNADEVVCGECGYATHTTAINPDYNVLPNTFNLFLPNLARHAS